MLPPSPPLRGWEELTPPPESQGAKREGLEIDKLVYDALVKMKTHGD
jgi:hypothetical protein